MWDLGYTVLPAFPVEIALVRIPVPGNVTWNNQPVIEDVHPIKTADTSRNAGCMTGEVGAAFQGVSVASIRQPSSQGLST